MFFELNNTTYVVKFSRVGTTTFATLFVVSGDGTLQVTNYEGKATPHYTDRFEKSKGRKVALADLLFQLEKPDPDEPQGILPEGLSKEDRKMIWEKYFEGHKK